MQSAYDDVFSALSDHTFTIPGVSVREPFDESAKTYPLMVVHEIVNKPITHGTETGEIETLLSYQIDIHTQNCLDEDDTALTRWAAGHLLVGEVSDLLDTTFKITRRTVRKEAVAADVLVHFWRGDCVLDASGYSYRP
ncbi:MAG: hypothetical protein JRC93_04050 [Deltaproteobacteria bacterium]|nr:hypothetical protein [Deltaproteobacteria bacterium]